MTTFDFAPLFRTTVGFDHLTNVLDSLSGERSQSYPPYNIERVEQDKYQITMAVAGFTEDEISVVAENNMLTVAAEKEEKEDNAEYLYRGIAERNFKRQFRLEDHVKVVSASMENGLLHIALEREIPEAMKPRTIAINAPQKKAGLLKSA